MTTSPAPTFAPPPHAVDALLHALARPDISFLDLAATHQTTPEALSLWITRPAIRERLAATADVVAWRTQFAASHVLDTALKVLGDICKSFASRDEATSTPDTPAHPDDVSIRPSSTAKTYPPLDPERAALLRARRSETARRAATTILRLTHTRSIGAPPIRPASPAPAVEAAERSKSGVGVIAPPNTIPQPHIPSPHSTCKVSTPKSQLPSRPNPAPNLNSNRLRASHPRPLSPVSSLLDLVGASSIRTDLTFSPRGPFP